MRSLQKFSYNFAKYLTDQQGANHEKRRILYYGLQVITGFIEKVVIVFTTAFILDTVIPMLIIFSVFGLIRLSAGGYHMDTSGSCLVTSLVLFIIVSVVSKYTYKQWTETPLILFVLLIIVFSLYIAIKWAPDANQFRPITSNEEEQKSKPLGCYSKCFQ